MRIALFGHREIASELALSLIAEDLAEHEIGVFLSGEARASDTEEGPLGELERLESALCEQFERGELWGDAAMAGVTGIAARHGRPVAWLDRPNSAEGISELRRFAPDLVVSVRYRRILKEEAIEVPRLGVLNLHSGLLPEYQGAMATFWSMLAGEQNMGWTLHYIVDGTIDTGPVIARRALPIDYGAAYLTNVLALYPAGCREVAAAVRAIARDGVVASKPQSGTPRYYSFPREADLSAFLSAGHRLYSVNELSEFNPYMT